MSEAGWRVRRSKVDGPCDAIYSPGEMAGWPLQCSARWYDRGEVARVRRSSGRPPRDVELFPERDRGLAAQVVRDLPVKLVLGFRSVHLRSPILPNTKIVDAAGSSLQVCGDYCEAAPG